jgi:hypothetical protein
MSVPTDVPSYAPQYAIKGSKPQRKVERDPKPAAQLVSLNVSGSLGGGIREIGDLVVPDFHGKSLRQVTEDALKAGLRLQSIGSGAAVEQEPPAGGGMRTGGRVRVRSRGVEE